MAEERDEAGQGELKRQLRRVTAALAGDTRDPLLLSEMAEVLTRLDRGAEAVSFRLNAAKCFKRRGKLEEAATSCDLLLELEAGHQEALLLRVDLPVDGAPREALQAPTLPEVDEDDGEGVDDGALRSQSTMEVEDLDVLEENTITDSDVGEDEEVMQLHSVDIDFDHDTVLPPEEEPEVEEEEVIELRAPARRRRSSGSEPKDVDAHHRLVPVSQPLVAPREFIEQGEQRTYLAGDMIIKERDQANELLLLTSGEVEVLKETWLQHEGRNRFQRLALLEAESCLGELALLGDGQRHATVRALEPCTVRVFTKSQVKAQMRQDAAFNRSLRRLYRQRLQDTLVKFSSLFRAMPPDVATAVLRRCKPKRMEPDRVVVKEGTQSAGVHIVLLGTLDVTSDVAGGTTLLHRFHDGDLFGGISHILKQLSPGTIRTRSFVQLLYLSPPDFEELTRAHPVLLDLMRPEAERRQRSYHSIIAGEAQYEVGTAVFLLEKKKGDREMHPPTSMKMTGWGADDE